MRHAYQNAVVVLTGAASGIGRAMAKELAGMSAKLVLIDLQEEKLHALAAEIGAPPGMVKVVPMDVTDHEGINRVFFETKEESGRLDYVFNNAGIGVTGDALNYEASYIDRMLAINFNAVISATMSAYYIMKEQGFGHIINTASLAGLIAFPYLTIYSGTKFGVVGFSKALRAEAEGHGVKISALCPGLIMTDIIDGGAYGFSYGYAKEVVREWTKTMYHISPEKFAPKALRLLARNPVVCIVPQRFRFLYYLFSVLPDALGVKLLQATRTSNQRKLDAMQVEWERKNGPVQREPF